MKLKLKELLAEILIRQKNTPIIAYQRFEAKTASTPNVNGHYSWSATITKTGYSPIGFSLQYGNSPNTTLGVENLTNTMMSGFSSRGNLTISVHVIYMRS